jgi:hypothetical protein
MDAAGAPAADESATEAAVAVASTLPEEEAVVDHQEHHQHEEHHVPDHGHIVPGGVAGTKTRKNFDERLKELKKFKLKHGHCNIPHKYSANPQLGTWCVIEQNTLHVRMSYTVRFYIASPLSINLYTYSYNAFPIS